jgi:hypothetical protein
MLDPANYVRVTQYTNQPIEGKWDGTLYSFPDSHDGAYLDVEKIVALHVFGYMGSEAQRQAAILRLGWHHQMPIEEARKQLDECVSFHDVPAFPTQIAEFRRARENPAERVPHTPQADGQGAVPTSPSAPPQDFDPYAAEKQKGGRRGGGH